MENLRKIYFRLIKDEDGYPPNEWELLWAKQLQPGIFQIDNIPFFVQHISYGDIVSVYEQDGELYFDQLLQQSYHSVFRVIVYESAQVSELRAKLRDMACPTELSHIPNLFSIDIPPSVSIAAVRNLLNLGEQRGHWAYEESSVRNGKASSPQE